MFFGLLERQSEDGVVSLELKAKLLEHLEKAGNLCTELPLLLAEVFNGKHNIAFLLGTFSDSPRSVCGCMDRKQENKGNVKVICCNFLVRV